MRNVEIIQFFKLMTNQPLPSSNAFIEWSTAQERLRQARHSFNLALSTTAVYGITKLVRLINTKTAYSFQQEHTVRLYQPFRRTKDV